MSHCAHCAMRLPSGALLCNRCGRPHLAPGRLTLVVSVSLVGLAALVALGYWVLSELVWLPFIQTGFYLAIGQFDLQGYVPYWTGSLERPNFFNAHWLLVGALLYIPLVTYMLQRFGLQRSAVVAFAGPLPFAILDIWTGWTRSIKLPDDLNAAEALRPAPNVLHFSGVLLVTGLAIGLVQVAYSVAVRSIVKRFPRTNLIQVQTLTLRHSPVTQPTETILTRPGPALAPHSPLSGGQAAGHPLPLTSGAMDAQRPPPARPEIEPGARLETDSVTPAASTFQSSTVAAADLPTLSAPPEPNPPMPDPVSATTETQAPSPNHLEAARPAPHRPAAQFTKLPEPESLNGVPVWMVVAGMAILIILGIILIIFAIRV